jgi:hypothetical protein
MTGDKSLLSDVRPWKGTVSGGDPRSEGNEITAIGTLNIRVKNERNEISQIEIQNVRYVENFEVTLIRPQQLWRELGIDINFNKKKIIGPDKRIIGNIVEYDMFLPYIRNCSIENIENEQGKGLLSREIWHERFGHISMDYIDLMKKKEIVHGLYLNSDPKINHSHKCNICYIMNNKRNTFSRIEDKKIRNFGEVISVDTDTLPIQSIEGYNYRLDIICHGSNWIWTFGLKRKSDAKGWIIFIIKRLRKTLVQIRVDGAKEFLAKSVQDACMKYGIEFKICDPYIHEENGKVERTHLTIDSKVRTWLKRSSLPKTLWLKASRSAVYVMNRTVTKALGLKTPYEIKEGVKPSVKQLRIFGCKAYVSGSAIFDETYFRAFEMKDDLEEFLVNDLDYKNDEDYVDDNDEEYKDDDDYIYESDDSEN